MMEHMPRKDVKLPPRMPEAAIIAELRAELDRLRADAQAAVALVVEQAAEAVEDTFPGTLYLSNMSKAVAAIRALAPADGLAAVEALRKERDDAVAEVARFQEDRTYVIGANDGWDAAVEQGEASPAVGKAMTRFWKRMAETHNSRAEKAEAELAAAQQREARRTFPILKGDGAKIDYQLVADHAEQARSNHGQSVDRLAARGGLSWCELYAVLHNRKWEKVDTNEAMIACRSLEARYLAALSHNGRKGQ